MNLTTLFPKFKQTDGYNELNIKQKSFCDQFFSRKNLFLTGSAGVGKSKVLNTIFEFLFVNNYYVGVTASTGIAALAIGGSTIHSFAGIGLGDEDAKSLIGKVFKNKKARHRILTTQTLFIDEISMVSAELFEKLDKVFRSIRGVNKPFGGIQLVVSGDFLQLCPINKNLFEEIRFCFSSPIWENANIKTHELTELMRQKDGSLFGDLLQKMRFGEATNEDFKILNPCYSRSFENKNPIKIFCKNADIDKYNNEKLNQIQSPKFTFVAKTEGDEKYIQFFDKNCQAPKILELKKGAQVVLLSNVDTEAGLVNGSIGIVEGFSPSGVIVKFYSGSQELIGNDEWEVKETYVDSLTGKLKYKVLATRTQIPLRLAYAISVHRSQGQSFDCAHIDLSEAWEAGMHYVALSRVRTLEGLKLEPFNLSDIRANPECVKFYKNLRDNCS